MMYKSKDIKIYTSYFGNVKKILKMFPDACLVSIAGKTPDWFNGIKYKKLAPHYDWWGEWHEKFKLELDSDLSTTWYTEKYFNTVLHCLEPKNIVDELINLADDKPIFLLCYETPDKFCHRHIVKKWLENCNIGCMEWIDESSK